ncbi:hypothetical protein ACVXZ4_17610 [Lacisediminihabitans sp. FW035]
MTDYPAPASGYIAQPYAPRPVRPPLTARAKRGTVIAGAVGFVLLGLGYAMVALPIGLALLVGFFALIIRAASSSSGPLPSGLEQFLAGLDFEPWVAALVILALVGVVVMAVAIVLSGRILAAHQVRRPWAVTWAGFGIAIVGSWVVSGITGVFTNVGFSGVRWDSSSAGSTIVLVVVISALIALVSNAVVGWLSFWWMAHAMRPAAVSPQPIVADPHA